MSDRFWLLLNTLTVPRTAPITGSGWPQMPTVARWGDHGFEWQPKSKAPGSWDGDGRPGTPNVLSKILCVVRLCQCCPVVLFVMMDEFCILIVLYRSYQPQAATEPLECNPCNRRPECPVLLTRDNFNSVPPCFSHLPPFLSPTAFFLFPLLLSLLSSVLGNPFSDLAFSPECLLPGPLMRNAEAHTGGCFPCIWHSPGQSQHWPCLGRVERPGGHPLASASELLICNPGGKDPAQG